MGTRAARSSSRLEGRIGARLGRAARWPRPHVACALTLLWAAGPGCVESTPFTPGGTGDATGETGGLIGECPTDLPGPPLVEVPTAAGGRYCVDATEVTRGDYAAFLLAAPAPQSATGDPAACQFNANYLPGSFGEQTDDALPVVWMDWCDAWAYCAWAGKRLCGAIGGGAIPWQGGGHSDAATSQWYSACSAGGTRTFPYGLSFEPETCNGDSDGPVAASGGTCEGGFPGIYHLSGNVWEWEDSCDGETGPDDSCSVRGGSHDSGKEAALACAPSGQGLRRSAQRNRGFRCCYP